MDVSHQDRYSAEVLIDRGLCFFLAALLAGCGAPATLPEQDLYTEANKEFEAENFHLASGRYHEMLEQYPFSDLAETARLRVAQAYYLDGSHEKAIAAFNDFERLHPTSPQLPFVEYTIAMAYLEQRRTRDRDKSATENALRQFERVRDRYPESLYERLAEYRIEQCRQHLASHELYVADFYMRSKRQSAGIARYQYILDHYADTDAGVIAGERLAEAAGKTSTGTPIDSIEHATDTQAPNRQLEGTAASSASQD